MDMDRLAELVQGGFERLEATLRPLPEKINALEASLTKAFLGVIKELEPVHLQIFGVHQRLDHMSDEMRQRFRALRAV